MIKTLVGVVLLIAFTVSFVACNTVEGAGKDTQNAGRAIKNAAEDSK